MLLALLNNGVALSTSALADRAWMGLPAASATRPPRTLDDSSRIAQLRLARTCYEHLAGRLGVAVFDALANQGALVRPSLPAPQPGRRLRSGVS
jgi:hypothetical protein